MAVERIRTAFEQIGPHRFTILYGAGIDDAFISHNSKELNIESALSRYLRQRGFQQVLFFSPHQAIYQVEANTQTTFPAIADRRDETNPADGSQMVYLPEGPFGDRMIYHQSPSARTVNERGMGDMHAIRILDACMKDPNQPRTAIIWSQAESAINYFEDPRLLAGIFADWLRLPASIDHTCLLVFSADNLDALQQIAHQLPIPEIRNHILRTQPGTHRGIHTIEISTPDESEIHSLVDYAQRLYGFSVQEEDVPRLVQWMSAEKVRARDWLVKLAEIGTFDIQTARQNGWFAAHRADSRSIEERLNALIGLDAVKDRVFEMSAWLLVNQHKAIPAASEGEIPLLHLVFTGNPGTGKTTVARLIGEIYHEIGVLRRGHIIEAKASDLVADHVGGTAGKTNRVVDEALDGVLFIDEAYRLTEPERGGFGQEALDTLLTRMEDDRQRLVVIVAGYPDKIERFLSSNPGLPRRFPVENRFHFEDYSTGELWQILSMMLEKRSVPYPSEVGDDLKDVIAGLYETRDATFGNAGEMRNLADALDRRRAARIVRTHLTISEPLCLADIPEKYQAFIQPHQVPIAEISRNLEGLVALEPFKAYIHQLLDQPPSHTPHINAVEGVLPFGFSHHLILRGRPGTGKSLAAVILGQVLRQLGLVRTGQVVEVTPDDLQRGGIGQSTYRARECVRQALDGVLYIDRAGVLFGGHSLSYTAQEVLESLSQAIQDYPQRLVVVIADSPYALEPFVQSQSRLLSRFGALLDFADNNVIALGEILAVKAREGGYTFDPAVVRKAERYLSVQAITEGERFGQAKAVITLLEEMMRRAAGRGEASLALDDVPEVTYSVVVGSGKAVEQALLKKNSPRIIQQEWVLPEMGLQPPAEPTDQQPGPSAARKLNPSKHRRRR